MLYSHPMNARTVPWVSNENIDTHTHTPDMGGKINISDEIEK